ncbi:MAG: DUF1365 domain-containing protein [Wenzhouxiangella sp.]|jgi:DUF1365 family protein|nr:DUF1365 domain-containing protein [Wenzhouxiangella sp.]
MDSAIATGRVWHERVTPRPHRFVYRTSYTLLDIDRIPDVFGRSRLWSMEGRNLVSFRRGDFLRPLDRSLRRAVLDRVAEETGRRPEGRILLLAHLRQWGFCFNPVSFYFCLDRNERLNAIVAEVHNTPWNERHAYVLDCRDQSGPDYRFGFDKVFHVSPFMPMDMRYDWRFRVEDERLRIHMRLKQAGRQYFSVGMLLSMEPMTSAAMRRMPLKFPLMTAKVVAAIYWQAFRLWLKKTPFHSHPDKVTQ